MRAKKAQQVSITFRTSSATRAVLDEIALNLERDRSYVVNEAIIGYVRWYEHEKQLIEQRVAVADRGGLIDHDEVFEGLEREFAAEMDRAS